MSGDVDDIVSARHDEDVAVLVDEAGVACLVIAREGAEVGFLEALARVPKGRKGPRRHR